MKTRIEYAIYDSRCIASPMEGILLGTEDSLIEAEKTAKQLGDYNCIYKCILEQNPKKKNAWFVKSEAFVKVVYPKKGESE